MYKKIILFSFCCLLAVSAQAQGFKGGVHIGLLATQVDGDNHAGYKKAGFFGGMFTNYALSNEKMQFQFELNYAQKGSSAQPVYKMKLHQVEPTVLFGWKFWNKFMLEAGLSCNILASAKEYASQVLVSPEYGSNFYRVHAAAIGGLAYRFYDHWGISFRASYSSPIGTMPRMRNGRAVEGYIWSNCLLFRLYYQF